MFWGNFWKIAKNNERLVENFNEIFEKNLVKIPGKCWENLGKF